MQGCARPEKPLLHESHCRSRLLVLTSCRDHRSRQPLPMPDAPSFAVSPSEIAPLPATHVSAPASLCGGAPHCPSPAAAAFAADQPLADCSLQNSLASPLSCYGASPLEDTPWHATDAVRRSEKARRRIAGRCAGFEVFINPQAVSAMSPAERSAEMRGESRSRLRACTLSSYSAAMMKSCVRNASSAIKAMQCTAGRRIGFTPFQPHSGWLGCKASKDYRPRTAKLPCRLCQEY